MRKIYIGYDLGDGETIVSYNVWTDDPKAPEETVKSFIMPTMNKNDIPIPTAFCKIGDNIFLGNKIVRKKMDANSYFVGNFKKRPTDLLKNYTEQDLADLYRIFKEETSDWPGVELPESLLKLRDDIVTFTDTLFYYKTIDKDGNEYCFMDELEPYFKAGDKIDSFTFCVGHPTKWGLEQEKGALDVAIYKKIMQQTCLGKGSFEYKGNVYPSELIMDAESRAAFLYTRKTYGINNKDNTFLLLDVGSSTVDLTALKQNGDAHNDGNTYLGARIIDYQILNFFKECIKKKNVYEYYDDYVRNNNGEKQMLLACRYAKEAVFTKSKDIDADEPNPTVEIKMPGSDGGKVRENFTYEDLKNIEKQPIKDVLQSELEQSEEVLNLVDNNTWEEELVRYLSEQNNILKSKDYNVGTLILTGSASVMPSVNRACERVFGIKPTKDPSRACSIANGLVYAGISNERSREFKENIEIFSRHLPSIIEEDVINLAENVSEFLADYIIDDVIKTQLLNWKKGEIATLEDSIEVIKHKCSEDGLKNILKYNDQYNRIIKNWLEGIVDKIAQKLSRMGQKYGVDIPIKDIIFPNVNVPGLDKSKGSMISLESLDVGFDILNSLISIIIGIIGTTCFPSLLVVILGIISLLPATLSGIIFTVLAAIPGPGWAVLAVLAGVGIAKLVQEGLDGFKNSIMSKICSWNFPQTARNLIPEKVLTGKLPEQKNKIKQEIYNSFSSEKTKNDLSAAIIEKLEIDRCITEIRYAIENNAVRTEWEQDKKEAPMSLRDQIAQRLERL
ncbi:MAG: hypothetical protein K5751_00915 [Treponemataceae bacterium]|nr:hypothetical protein [Treponemataceae bacterium]